ncbi:MAG: hypothetical protein ABSB99_11560 [Acidimicrobiales bacterium]|jgi:hypothetical protein
MDEATNLRNSSHWRLAVWGLRVIGPGLAVVVVGLVALLWSTGIGQAILAVGMGIYLVGVMITVVGIILVYREVPPPRPNFIWLRWSLLHDAVHARSASAEQVAEGTGPLAERHAQSPHMENLRNSAHWRLAIWGVRVIGPGLAVVITGLITLLWSTAAGKAILAVGIGIYLFGLVLSFVEVHRAYGEVQPPRPNYARVQQTLWHDALHARS